MTETKTHPFIDRLQELAKKEERGALATLRRGLGQPPGAAPEMFRYVEPYLSPQRSRAEEAAYYLVASLFALHPQPSGTGNFGDHMRACNPIHDANKEEALERRFSALLAAHPDDLPDYLRQAVSFLKSKEIPVNWQELSRDLQHWDSDDRWVQKKWAKAFWGRARSQETEPQP